MYRHYIDVAGYKLNLNTESERLNMWITDTFGPNISSYDNDADLWIEVQDDYGLPFQGFRVDITSDNQHVWYRRADYLVQVDRQYKAATIFTHDTFALKHALMNLYSAFTVHQKSGLLIHSSCIIEGPDAFLFSGHSGAGKSTVARLSAPRPLLSNEATMVRIHDFGVMAYNSYAFRSDPGIFVQRAHPLRAIHFLHQSGETYRTKLSVEQAMVQLVDKVFFWAHDPMETSQLVRMVKRIVETVPSYNLYFQKNDEFWREIS